MKVLNYGSLNVDYVYQVPHMVTAGETLLSSKLNVFSGGKGLNQSIALAKAGVAVDHAGMIGSDGRFLLDECTRYGVGTNFLKKTDEKNGHTIIQVDETGQNCILLYGGTNQMQTKEYIDDVLSHFSGGDVLVLQNEVNLLDYLIDRASELGMRIILNPSPMNDSVLSCALEKVDLFLLNEIEGEQLTGTDDPEQILNRLHEKYPAASFVLTLGSRGAWYYDGTKKAFQDIFPVKAVDTTAAGDTFTGYFIAAMLDGMAVEDCLKRAALASSIAVSRAGAAPSIPSKEEVEEALKRI